MSQTFLVQAREAKTKDGKSFRTFKGELGKGGRLVDVRFKMDVDTRLFAEGTLFNVTAETVNDASDNYIYPRFYVGDVVSVERLK